MAIRKLAPKNFGKKKLKTDINDKNLKNDIMNLNGTGAVIGRCPWSILDDVTGNLLSLCLFFFNMARGFKIVCEIISY